MDNPKVLNGLTLAYLGDAVFELEIRKHMINIGYTKVNNLHKNSIKYTNALAQANIMRHLVNNNLLTEEEVLVYKRGRNSKVNLTRKNIELSDYLDATGFESLIGYLYLLNQNERINDFTNLAIKLAE